nr:uncharacterized protein LOC111999255 [Quercus suber]
MAASFLDVLQLCSEKSNLVDLFAMTVSQIWTRRNKLRVGEDAAPLDMINQLASASLQVFIQSSLIPTKVPSPIKVPSPPKVTKWLPPPSNWVKINFDGATFSDLSSAGLGAIIRNDLGPVMAAFTHLIPLPTSVEMVEVLAARSALCFAKELGFNNIIVEGDSEIVIKALSTNGPSFSSIGHIVKDVKVLASSLGNVSFNHTRRQGNRVAHGLARLACNFIHFQSWMEDVPPAVEGVYASEICQ